MIINLSSYHLGPKVFTLVFYKEAVDILVNKKLNVVLLQNHKLNFYPDSISVQIQYDVEKQFNLCNNFDVFQIDQSGNAYRCYNSASDDNGLVLTAHCNSNCIMCPASDGQRKYDIGTSVDDYLEIIRHIPTDAEHITITGGEPFLIGPRIFEIFNALKNSLEKTKYLLLTNGRAFSYAPYIDLFNSTAPHNIIIGIPLHGYNSDTHDKITRSPGGFVQTVLGIKNLICSGHFVELRIVVSKLNYTFITHIARFIISEFSSVYRVVIMGLEMLGNAAKNQSDVWLSYRQAFNSAREAIDILVQNKIDVSLYNFPLCSIDKKYRMIAKKSISDYKVRYPDQCMKCDIKDACGGIFQGTIRLAASDVRPVKNNDKLL